jgi:hypothetical protein
MTMDDEPDEPRCLHCDVLEAILKHFEAVGERHGETTVINCSEVMIALAQVVAETLASQPDDERREMAINDFISEVTETVLDIRARGAQGELLRLH